MKSTNSWEIQMQISKASCAFHNKYGSAFLRSASFFKTIFKAKN